MKPLIKSFTCLLAITFLLFVSVKAAEKPKSQTVTIQTSAICGSCKARIEKIMKDTKGVEQVLLNMNNKKLKIKYNPTLTNPDLLRVAVSNIGYDADQVKKNETAFNNLPECCQKPMKGDMH